jgi:hypothetical protein
LLVYAVVIYVTYTAVAGALMFLALLPVPLIRRGAFIIQVEDANIAQNQNTATTITHLPLLLV